MPPAAEFAKSEAIQTHDDFFRALLNADLKTIEDLATESFILTHSGGSQDPRAQLLQRLSSGQLKYTKLETTNVVASVTGDTAVVRGTAAVQVAGSVGGAVTKPFTVAYTLVFANQGGAWQAVALHGSAVQ